MAASDAKPIPIKNTAHRITFPLRKTDGSLKSGAAGLDSEVSIDGAAFADAGSEATEIGTTGIYYLDLTAAEMNGDTIAVQTKYTGGGNMTAVTVMYPQEAGDIKVDVQSISGDSTAADNLETATDGGSYNVGGGGVVAASVTAEVTANVTKLSGDATAADNAEAFFDGTGYAGTNNTIPTVTTAVNLTNAPTSGDLTATMKTSVTTACTASTPTAAAVTGAVGSVTGAVGSVTGNVGGNVVGSVGSVTGLTASNLDTTVSSRATPAQVNTEVLDVLNVDTFAEPGQEAPAATNTLAKKIGYLFKFLRNRHTQTSTTFKVYADDATTVDQKATVSDDGTTFDRTEIATGP